MRQDEASETELSLNDDSLPLDQSYTAMVVMPAPRQQLHVESFFHNLLNHHIFQVANRSHVEVFWQVLRSER